MISVFWCTSAKHRRM